MPYVCIAKMGVKYGLMALKEEGVWSIWGFESKGDGIRFFEDGYNRCHERGGSWSNSATMNWLLIQPSIIECNLEKLESIVQEKKVVSYRTVAGSINYIPLTETAKEYWDSGFKPKLIGTENPEYE